jgi:fumarate hydratase, class II
MTEPLRPPREPIAGASAAETLYGRQTRLAINNFTISGLRFPSAFIHALGLIKACAARVNGQLGVLPTDLADAIEDRRQRVAAGELDDQFPVDIFQTGSGTSSNMNANEVIATLASRALGRAVHPNDDVNRGQSSNDVIPTAIHIAAALALPQLGRAVGGSRDTIRRRADEYRQCRQDRPHSPDGRGTADARPGDGRLGCAVTPIWSDSTTPPGACSESPKAVPRSAPASTPTPALPARSPPSWRTAPARVHARARSRGRDRGSGHGGRAQRPTAGPGTDADEDRQRSALDEQRPGRRACRDSAAGAAARKQHHAGQGQSGDPGSGGHGLCAGHRLDTAIALAAQDNRFQLCTMLPLIAFDLLQQLTLLTGAARFLNEQAIARFVADALDLEERARRNAMLATALTPLIGYDLAGKVARTALEEGRAVIDVARELSGLPEDQLRRLLDPQRMAWP